MGNHCIDCDFCGRDQRIYDSCCEEYRQSCEEYRQSKNRKEEALRARDEENVSFLEKFGLSVGYDSIGYRTRMDARDVVEFLKKHESKFFPNRFDKIAGGTDS